MLLDLRVVLVDGGGLETLGVVDIHGLNVAVQLLLGALLVVTSPGDADADPVWHALDTLLPHLLVQLRVDADVGGTLFVWSLWLALSSSSLALCVCVRVYVMQSSSSKCPTLEVSDARVQGARSGRAGIAGL